MYTYAYPTPHHLVWCLFRLWCGSRCVCVCWLPHHLFVRCAVQELEARKFLYQRVSKSLRGSRASRKSVLHRWKLHWAKAFSLLHPLKADTFMHPCAFCGRLDGLLKQHTSHTGYIISSSIDHSNFSSFMLFFNLFRLLFLHIYNENE